MLPKADDLPKSASVRRGDAGSRYLQMFEKNPAVQLLIDPATGAIVDANPAAAEFYGYDLETLRRTNIAAINILPQETLARVITQLVHEQHCRFLFQHRLASGDIRDVEVSACQVTLDGQSVLHSIVHDITEQKRAEATLRRQIDFEKLIVEISRLFLNLSSDELDTGVRKALQAIGEFDGVDRSYLYLVSRELTTVTAGYEWCAPGVKTELGKTMAVDLQSFSWMAEQLLAHGVLHAPCIVDLPPEAKAEKAEFAAQGVQSALLVALRADPFFGILGFDVVQTPKTWREESITLLKIVRDIIVQALQRQRAEQLRSEEAQVTAALARVGKELISSLRTPTILDHLCQVTAEVLACDYSHTYLRNVQEDAYSLVASWGETPEQAEALRLLRFPTAQVEQFMAHLQREDALEFEIAQLSGFLPIPTEFFVQRGVTRVIYMAVRQGAEVVGAQTASYRERSEPRSPQRLRIARGIAQLASLALENARLLEETEQVNRLKTDFLATMSHELRTPLNIIVGYVDLLSEGDYGELTAQQLRLLERVSASSRELLELINATLDVSRFEAGRLPIELGEVELTALMTEVRQETENRLLKPGVFVEWRTPPPPLTLYTDRAKLKMIIKNLVGNALKFTESGTIIVETRPLSAGVEISVSDPGIGIPADVLPVIFDMFRQGDSSTTRRYGGVGLGLYIVRRLLDLLAGTVSVESTLGRGSTFRVWLPKSQ